MFNLNNPIPFLFREMWKFSQDRKKYVVLVYFLSTMSNVLGLILPLIIANIFNIIQETGVNSNNIKTILFYISLILI
ncbi:hypothetical protein HN836_01740, partial [Candidatus Woesearchaeota archaeon]|nr:hypothetical protein [Candidatus Woesearchaeota archaeon]